MASNEAKNFLVDWITQLTFLLSFIVPTYLVLRKLVNDYHERQISKDKSAMQDVAKHEIELRLRQIKENYIEMQEMIKRGDLK